MPFIGITSTTFISIWEPKTDGEPFHQLQFSDFSESFWKIYISRENRKLKNFFFHKNNYNLNHSSILKKWKEKILENKTRHIVFTNKKKREESTQEYNKWLINY